MLKKIALLLSLSLCLGIAACDDDKDKKDDKPSASQEGLWCLQGTCGEYVEEDYECLTNDECAGNQNGSVCITEENAFQCGCNDNADCGAGYKCNSVYKMCIENDGGNVEAGGECYSDSQCAAGLYCMGGKCGHSDDWAPSCEGKADGQYCIEADGKIWSLDCDGGEAWTDQCLATCAIQNYDGVDYAMCDLPD